MNKNRCKSKTINLINEKCIATGKYVYMKMVSRLKSNFKVTKKLQD